MTDRWSSWPAPAKLNLFLRIVGRRHDGYHLLQTVFRLLDWGDTVWLRPRADGLIERQGASAPGVAADADLAVRAAKLLQEHTNIRQGADIRIEKRIPSGAGLGGGSSDAATVLRALDGLWDTRLPLAELAELGLQLGADVPVFVHGHNAWAEGVGERLVPLQLPPAWYLLAASGVHAPTAALFQAPELTRDSAPATIEGFLSDAFAQGIALGNVFEPVLRRREPVVDALFAALARVGQPRLTGSGSAVFVEFRTAEAALGAKAMLPPGVTARVVAAAARSPLLDALQGVVHTGAWPSG